MPAQSSLDPRYSESRARSGRKAWYILIPPHLSEMGKEQRPYYESKKAAILDAQRLQRRSDNFGLSLNALTPARIALASEAFNLVDPRGLDLGSAATRLRSFLTRFCRSQCNRLSK